MNIKLTTIIPANESFKDNWKYYFVFEELGDTQYIYWSPKDEQQIQKYLNQTLEQVYFTDQWDFAKKRKGQKVHFKGILKENPYKNELKNSRSYRDAQQMDSELKNILGK